MTELAGLRPWQHRRLAIILITILTLAAFVALLN